MRHVGHEVRAALVADVAHALIVVVPGVRRRSGDDELGAVEHGVRLERVVVDGALALVQAVRQGLEEDARGADLLLRGVEAVREVPAVGQVQAHDAVVRVEQRGVHAKVGGRPGEHLHVDAPLVILQAERLQRALLAQALRLVDELVAAVVALAGQALGVLVRQARTVHLHHRAAGEVLARDELEAEALARLLLGHDGEHLKVSIEVRVLGFAVGRGSRSDAEGFSSVSGFVHRRSSPVGVAARAARKTPPSGRRRETGKKPAFF